ncbi:MAG TPA: STAS domain-containing protein [Actinomycetota bacterium]|jgi:anti-sigma B factor antagonist|nr:STAS domain-containing protein [Actinomycetota bacterium]
MSQLQGRQKLDPEPEPATGQTLTFQKHSTGKSVYLKLNGELDAHSSDLLRRTMRAEEHDGCHEVVLDLEDLEFIDSTGLSTLIAAASRAQAGGWTISVINARGKVRRVFDLTDMDSMLAYCQKTALQTEY